MILDALRTAGVILWGFVLMRRAGAIWRVLRGHPRYYDVLWALIAAIAAMIIGFNILNLADMASDTARAGLHTFSVMLALSTIRVVRAYQGAQDGG